jgi:hypothetical protein
VPEPKPYLSQLDDRVVLDADLFHQTHNIKLESFEKTSFSVQLEDKEVKEDAYGHSYDRNEYQDEYVANESFQPRAVPPLPSYATTNTRRGAVERRKPKLVPSMFLYYSPVRYTF